MKNEMSNSVYCETQERLSRLITGDETVVTAKLAELRHGLGLEPGDNPSLWGMLFEKLPESMLGKYGKPSKEERAIYHALTLYALHQQGNNPKSENMNIKKVSLGKAAAVLVEKDGGSEEARARVSRRFNQIALSSDVETLVYYLRTFIPLLRTENIGLDYAMLAKDIYLYQTSNGQANVRFIWGQDYYSNEENEEG